MTMKQYLLLLSVLLACIRAVLGSTTTVREQELVGHLVRKHRKLNSSKKSKSSSSGSHLSSSKKSGKKGGKKNGDMPTDAPTIPAQDIAVYSTSLSGAAEVPAPVETDVGGSITLMTREDSTGMIFNLKIDNPSGVPILGVAGAHLHCGAEGENGPVIVFLAPIIPGGTVSPQIDYYASFDETGVADTPCGTTIAELIKALDDGLIYANIHSEGNPGGEVRGQLALNEDANVVSADVEMTGDNEVPPVTTNVVGEATFVYEINLNGEPDGIGFFGSVTNPDAVPITAAHIHCAAKGANGPVIATLLPLDANGRTSSLIRFRRGLVSSSLIETDCGTTISEVIASMNAGNVYVNVHSTDNPDGEVRGQICLSRKCRRS